MNNFTNIKQISYIIAMVLLVIGGINWGLIGIFDFNFVAFLFEWTPALARLVYILVAVAAIYVAVMFCTNQINLKTTKS
jgi:uncharacterized membrane protein YuzA (DUF378 family)